jgi:hypothetical protein
MRGPIKLVPKSSVPQKDEETNLNYGQQWARAVRPQLPRDSSQEGHNRWVPGTMPKGGFRSVFDFSDGPSTTKTSYTRGGGKKVY